MSTEPVAPPTLAVTTITVTPARPGQATVELAGPAHPATASGTWGAIRDCSYEMRAQFFAGLKPLEAKVDVQLDELLTGRAAITAAAESRRWDAAIKEMSDARSYLSSRRAELDKATRENWEQAKEQVGRAWVRAQEAYARVGFNASI
jgi:hypothetical protein